VRIAREAAAAVHAAHQQGVLHRDLKPSNLLLDADGRVRILDFGIARPLAHARELTQTGELVGTPAYMAPEQLTDAPEAVDARADVYSLGMVLYEMLTGVSPMAHESLFETLKNVESYEPPPPSSARPDVPAELDAVVLRAVAKDRDGRPATAAQLAEELRRVAGGPSPETPTVIRVGRAGGPRRRIGAAAAGAAAAAIACLAWLAGRRENNPLPAAPANAPTASAADGERDLRAERAVREALALKAGAQAVDRRTRLQTILGDLTDAKGPGELYWRGVARKYLGDYTLALQDLRAAADRRHAGAALEAMVVWHLGRTLGTR